jgi:F0F1-type ATP synthase assembly protein I
MKLLPDASNYVAKMRQRNANPRSSMHSFELVLTIVLLVLLGRFIDSKIDTTPLFTIVFALIAIVGSFTSAYYRYKTASEELDKEQVWARETTRTSIDVHEDVDDGLVVPQGYGKDDE